MYNSFHSTDFYYASLYLHQVDSLLYLSLHCQSESGRISALKCVPRACRFAKHYLKRFAELPPEIQAEQLKTYEELKIGEGHRLICYDDRNP